MVIIYFAIFPIINSFSCIRYILFLKEFEYKQQWSNRKFSRNEVEQVTWYTTSDDDMQKNRQFF